MIPSVQLICLFSVIVAVTSASPLKEKPIPKSRLILEYDWPQPIKNLKRYPHPESCTHFYHVKHDGSHVVKRCNIGEIFDYETLRCKEKAFAKCWKDLIKRIIPKKRKHFSCPFPWGLYPDTEECSHFHECLGGKSYLRECPADTLFDKTERTCVIEKEAMCADETDALDRDGYRCPYKWGLFTHPKDCSKYFECLQKVPSIRTCKKNMLFDNFGRMCLPKNRVKCGERLNPYENKDKLTIVVNPRVSIPAEQEFSRTLADKMNTQISQKITSENDITEIPRIQSETSDSKYSRAESKGITSERPIAETKGITAERPITESKGIIGERPITESKGIASEHPITESKRVTEKRPITEPKKVIKENSRTEFERITTDGLRSEPGRTVSEHSITKSEEVASEHPGTKLVEVSVEDTKAKFQRTTLRNLHTEPEVISSNYPRTNPEEIESENPRTKLENVISELPMSLIKESTPES